MTRVFAVDPGLRSAGVAMFVDGDLVAAGMAKHNYGDGPDQWVGMGRAIGEKIRELGGGRLNPTDEVVIEYMSTRRGRRDAHDALIQLSIVSGAAYVHGPSNRVHAPTSWTGNRPKKKNHLRIRRRLRSAERDVLSGALERSWKRDHKEILDAVGIGLWRLKRL